MNVFLEIGLILAIATVVSVIMQSLRLPLLLGHLLTGILVGPAVFGILQSRDAIAIFSQLGITALLFIVGLSLNPRIIRDVGKISLITGLGQIFFTSAIGFGVCRLLGFAMTESIFLAIALTFASTIIVLKLLSDRHDLGTLHGKIAMGFLLVQDIVATLILIGVSAVDGPGTGWLTLETLAIKLFAVIGVLLIMAGAILPRLTRLFATSQEFLFIFSVGWGIGLAALFHFLGLSVEIGALAAGVTLASSPYHFEISSKMKQLRDFFIILFFISLGSQLTSTSILHILAPAAFLSLFVMIGNPLIVLTILTRMGYTKKTSFYAALTVGQVSEFSFVLLIVAAEKGFISGQLVPLLTTIALITITGSSLLMIAADPIYKWLAPALTLFERKRTRPERKRLERTDAILFGCHRVGSDFLVSLANMKLTPLVVDFDPSVIERLEKRGIRCRYGDASDNEFVDELDLKRVQLAVSTIPDFDTNAYILHKTRAANPDAVVVVMAHTIDEANLLYQDGASYVIMPHFLGGNRAAMIIEKYGPDHEKLSAERTRHLKHLKLRESET